MKKGNEQVGQICSKEPLRKQPNSKFSFKNYEMSRFKYHKEQETNWDKVHVDKTSGKTQKQGLAQSAK